MKRRQQSNTTTRDSAQRPANDIARLPEIAETYRAAFRAGQASAHAIGHVLWGLGTFHIVELPLTALDLERAYERARRDAKDDDVLAVLASARTILSDYLALRRDTKAYRP